MNTRLCCGSPSFFPLPFSWSLIDSPLLPVRITTAVWTQHGSVLAVMVCTCILLDLGCLHPVACVRSRWECVVVVESYDIKVA
jgi:hypothetical protein